MRDLLFTFHWSAEINDQFVSIFKDSIIGFKLMRLLFKTVILIRNTIDISDTMQNRSTSTVCLIKKNETNTVETQC